jgi:RNA polymerase sigma-70 factor (ECF subfamily)
VGAGANVSAALWNDGTALTRQRMSEPTIEQQDARDMQRLASGHDAALTDLMERYEERLFHYLIRQLRDESDAADIAQETFVRVYQNRAKFDARQKFSTWLYAIATNLARDRLKWRARHPQVSLNAEKENDTSLEQVLPDAALTPDETLVSSERAEAVRQAVAEIPEDLRTPLVLAEYEGLSHAEIGDILKCSVKAVESRIYRARQRLRTALLPTLEHT